MSLLPTYAVFAFDRVAFADWVQNTLVFTQLNVSKGVAETQKARYEFVRDIMDARGRTYAGVILLEGFDQTAGSWSDARDLFVRHVRRP